MKGIISDHMLKIMQNNNPPYQTTFGNDPKKIKALEVTEIMKATISDHMLIIQNNKILQPFQNQTAFSTDLY